MISQIFPIGSLSNTNVISGPTPPPSQHPHSITFSLVNCHPTDYCCLHKIILTQKSNIETNKTSSTNKGNKHQFMAEGILSHYVKGTVGVVSSDFCLYRVSCLIQNSTL